VEQPPDFESEGYPNHVYKLHKTLYGHKQAPRAWYECLRVFLIENDFRIGKADSTLFTRKMGKYLFVCQICVDDIIFGSTNKSFCDELCKIITDRFKMFMMEVLTFFLDFKSSKPKREPSLDKRSILVTYSKSLAWIKQSQSRHPWVLMVILILTWAARQLIKRYITLRLDLYFTFVHLGPISCLVCVCVQDYKPHPKIVI
jgi:hypothetical protein